MAFLGLKVPDPTARILSEIDFSQFGEKVDASEMHVTICYLGKGIDIARVAQMIAPIFDVIQSTKPFVVSTSRVSTFPPNKDDGVPIIARVDSNDLHALKASLTKTLLAQVPDFPSEKWPEFKPHVTLGYSSDSDVNSSNVIDIQIPTISWGAHEVVLWGGDKGDNKLIVTFPLTIATKTASQGPGGRQKALYRAFTQLANRGHLLTA